MTRAVVVQPSVYGFDNRCSLDAAASLGPNGRAVVEIDESSVTDEELFSMHAKGARGVRLSVALVGDPDDGLFMRIAARVTATATRIEPLNWHIEIMTPSWLSVRLLPVLRSTGLSFCLGHVAGLRPCHGPVDGDLDIICEELEMDRRCHVKLSAFYRLSPHPDYSDLVPVVKRLAAVAPGQMLWGSDYPHPKYTGRVTPVEQLEMLRRSVTDASTLERILVQNPLNFYRFE